MLGGAQASDGVKLVKTLCTNRTKNQRYSAMYNFLIGASQIHPVLILGAWAYHP